MKESVNLYISICCNVEATKPPCVKVKKAVPMKKGKGKRTKGTMGEDREKKPEFSTLGSWRCTRCGKPCKVSVMPRPPKEEKPVEVASE